MKDIKLRIKSVESTMQITKAMELVASSKLKKARDRMEGARPYFLALYGTLSKLAAYTVDFSSPFVQERPVKKSAYVLIAGDRGLAGGYNNNMFKLFTAHAENKNAVVIPVGKKAVEFCKRRNIETITEEFSHVEDFTSNDCTEIGEQLTYLFEEGEIDEVFICYTTFLSMLSQSPEIIQVLPLTNMDSTKYQRDTITEYEPEPEELFHVLVPQFITGMVYGAVTESWASELAARRTAMDSVSKNAQEMVSDLSLQYNRARQAAITQEITEIVAGAGEG